MPEPGLQVHELRSARVQSHRTRANGSDRGSGRFRPAAPLSSDHSSATRNRSETALGERHEDGDGELGTRTCGKDLAGRRSKDEPNEDWPTVPLCVGDMASKPSRTRVVPGWSLCTPVPKRYVDGSGPVTGARIRQGHHAGRTPAPSAVDQARSWAERTASEQGLPGKVIERSVLQDVAVLLGSDSGPPGRSDPRRVEDVAASDGGANGDGFQESRDDRSLSGRSEGVPLAS